MTQAQNQAEERLEQLFARIERMPDSELMMLRAVWEDGDPTARQQAWQAVKRVLKAGRRDRLLDEGRARLAAWVNNYLTATTVEYGNFLVNAGSGMDPNAVRRAALPPLLDAVAAVVAADGLAPAEQEVLLAPVESVGREQAGDD